MTEDWFRKTASLRDLERRLRDGEHPRGEEVATVLRHALTETVGEDLPLSVDLVRRIAGMLDGAEGRRPGRPREDAWAVLERLERALELSYAVEVRHRELRRSRAPRPKATAIAEVAHARHVSPKSLRTLVYRGPPGYDLPWPWKDEVQRYFGNRGLQDSDEKTRE